MIQESIVTKLFKYFGDTAFRPESLKFNYGGDLYTIHSVDEKQISYGNDGWTLKEDTSTQFEVFKVEATSRICSGCCTLYLRDRGRDDY